MKKNKVHFVILCGLMAGTLFGAEAPIQSQKKTFSERFQAEKKVWQNGIAAAKKRHIQKKALNKQELRAYNAVLKRLGGLAALLAAIGVISLKVQQKRRAERERQARHD